MTDPQQDRRSRWKIVGWTTGVISLIAVIAVLVVVVQLSAALSPKQEPTVTPSNIPALEDQLRSKGPAEEALTRYESALQATADDLTKLVPGLTWRWNRDVKHLSCGGEFAETRGIRVITRNLVSNGPIPDNSWPAALQLLRDHAAQLGCHTRIRLRRQAGTPQHRHLRRQRRRTAVGDARTSGAQCDERLLSPARGPLT